MRFAVLTLAVSALLATAAPVRAADQTMVYDLYAGGFHALDATITLDEAKDRYAMKLASATTKTFKLVAPWSGTFSVDGWLKQGRRQTENYNVVSSIKQKRKTKDYKYDRSGKLISFKATENGEDKTPEDIGPELTPPGITDVLTATLQAQDRVNKTGSCSGSSLIFDGDRTFSLDFKGTGAEMLPASDYNAYQGEAIGCTFEMVPGKGKWKQKTRGWMMLQEQGRKLKSMPTVWFARLPGSKSDSYVPVRLQVKTNYGTLLLHLRSAAGADGRVFTPPVKKSG